MYPPRPKTAIPLDKINDYEHKGYVGQLKFNGTRTLVEMKPGGEVKLWTRQREPHKAYRLSEGMREDLCELHASVDSKKHLVLDGELMHSKTTGLKDCFIAFDLLVCEDFHFIGMSMLERYMILDDIMGNQEDRENQTGNKIAIYVREHMWLAETFIYNLSDRFDRLKNMNEVEGMVLKRPEAKLERGHSEDNNSSWLVKARKPTKNYRF